MTNNRNSAMVETERVTFVWTKALKMKYIDLQECLKYERGIKVPLGELIRRGLMMAIESGRVEEFTLHSDMSDEARKDRREQVRKAETREFYAALDRAVERSRADRENHKI